MKNHDVELGVINVLQKNNFEINVILLFVLNDVSSYCYRAQRGFSF